MRIIDAWHALTTRSGMRYTLAAGSDQQVERKKHEAAVRGGDWWRINVGAGINAPPMTYSVNGKQYIAIASGLWSNARNKLSRSAEIRNFSNATMIFVFAL